MSAYVVMLRERTTDPDQMNLYVQQAISARDGHAVMRSRLWSDMKDESVRRSGIRRLVDPSLSTMVDAENWYRSPKYQTALQHRQLGAEYRVFIIEGIDIIENMDS